MKILMLTSGSIHSSLTFRALSFARELVGRGHKVELVAPASDKYNHFTPDTETTLGGVTIVHPRQLRSASPFSLIPYILSAAWKVLTARADAVYIYKPTPITVVGVLARLLGKPVVLDMDDRGSEVMRLEGQPAVMVKLVEWCENLSAHAATQIVTASTQLQRDYRRRYPHKLITWIPNGVSPSDYAVQPAGTTPKLIFFGALGRANLLSPVIAALPQVVAAVPSVRLLVQGDGRAKAELEAQVAKLGLDDQVSFTGAVPMFEAPAAWRAGDIGLCYMPNEPSARAASNMKVFQYLAAGLVPLVSPVGDLPTYVAAGTIGYAPTESDIATTLIAALSDPAELQRRARLSRAHVSNHYAWPKLTQDLERVLS